MLSKRTFLGELIYDWRARKFPEQDTVMECLCAVRRVGGITGATIYPSPAVA